MTAVVRSSLAAFALLLLAACGGPSAREPASANEADEKAAAKALGRDTDATVLDDMIQTQDRARAVEGVVLGHKDDLDKALEESAGNGSADDQ